MSYHDKGVLPIIDLGVDKEQGWTYPEITPERPMVEPKQVSANVVTSKSASSNTVSKSTGIWKRLLGSLGSTGSQTRKNENVVNGFFDNISMANDYLSVGGWILLNSGAADSVEFHALNNKTVKAKRVTRPDLESKYAHLNSPEAGGFEAKLKAANFKTELGYEFIMVTSSGETVASRTHVTFSTAALSEISNSSYQFWKSARLDIG